MSVARPGVAKEIQLDCLSPLTGFSSDRSTFALGQTEPVAGTIFKEDAFVKEAAERAEALKADLEADLRDRQAAGSQKLFGPFNPPLCQVLMRRLPKSLSEQTYEVVARETCPARNLFEVERQVVTIVHKSTSAAKPAENIRREISRTLCTRISRHDLTPEACLNYAARPPSDTTFLCDGFNRSMDA
jgi:hypothetical protein